MHASNMRFVVSPSQTLQTHPMYVDSKHQGIEEDSKRGFEGDLKELCRQRDLRVGRRNGDCNDLESNSAAEADRIEGETSGSEAGDDNVSGCVKRANRPRPAGIEEKEAEEGKEKVEQEEPSEEGVWIGRCVLPNTALHELILAGYSSVSPVVMLVRDSSKLDCRHSLRYSSVMLVR
ncbi:hypothetical protein B296_00008542 [Ensete ventricosum]|uniref:Uncharacterized protein n=1 Tax=Ensete ventricosum TaxID=4639 RepID=A0A426ZE37_ENSVE|nr:hypothetical protein B296_00008542 [Ensete ventricosum]